MRVIYHLPKMRRMLLLSSTGVAYGVGRRVQSRAKRYVRKDSGRLAESIEVLLTTRNGMPAIQVGSDVEYAAYVHEGTGVFGPHKQRIYPKRGRYLVFQSKSGELVFAKSVRGMRPNRYLTRALRDVMRTMPGSR